MGDKRKQALRVQFGGKLRLQFHGAKITSDAGLLPFRELDKAHRVTEKGSHAIAVRRFDNSPMGANRHYAEAAESGWAHDVGCRANPPIDAGWLPKVRRVGRGSFLAIRCTRCLCRQSRQNARSALKSGKNSVELRPWKRQMGHVGLYPCSTQ